MALSTFTLCATFSIIHLSFQFPKLKLKKKMATHSSIIACKLPWMEEPGGLQSMRSQRVRHNWSSWASKTETWSSLNTKSPLPLSTSPTSPWHPPMYCETFILEENCLDNIREIFNIGEAEESRSCFPNPSVYQLWVLWVTHPSLAQGLTSIVGTVTLPKWLPM